MLSWLSQYYGIDLLATAVTFLGIWLVGSKKKSGFLFSFIGNVLWLIVAWQAQSGGILIANIGIAVLNVRGYWMWRRA